MPQESTSSRRLATNTFHNAAALVGMHTRMRLVLVQGGETYGMPEGAASEGAYTDIL